MDTPLDYFKANYLQLCGGLHQESNENGKRLIHFAASRTMVIGTILFQHKDIQKITWRSPDVRVRHFSQMDHLLIDSQNVSL
jgi:hypothetical protein